MLPWVVNYRPHLRRSRKSRGIGIFRFAFSTLFTYSTRLISFIFHLPYLLPSSVSRNPFVPHSYENCRGVYQQFPFRTQPSFSLRFANQRIPTLVERTTHHTPLYSSAFFSHSCALFGTCKKINSFVFMRFRTLCQK